VFADFYASELQGTWLLWPVPLAFLAYLLSTRRTPGTGPDARFVRAYCLVFACETLLDSFATGPLARWLGLHGTGAGTALLLFFVLLGDYRVFVLLLRLSRPSVPLASHLGQAALWTLPVPLFAYASDILLRALAGDLPPQTIWLTYEVCFLALALYLRARVVPWWVGRGRPARLAYLRGVTAYVAAYYALWATADVLILLGGLDAGWLLRVVPNQLYYAFFVPFVFFRFASSDQAERSTSTQASR
jgi:hypothetical protein